MNKNPVSYFMAMLTALVVPFLFFKIDAVYAGLMSVLFILILIVVYNSNEVKRYRINRSFKYIKNYKIPQTAILKFNLKRKLNSEQLLKTVEALKQFFMIYSLQIHDKNNHKYAMPSKVADELWHEFMLSSKDYSEFCERAFGQFLHHTPDSPDSHHENKGFIQFSKPSFNKPLYKEVLVTHDNLNKIKKNHELYMIGGIPAIFALDSYLNIDDGFYYSQDSIHQMELQMALHNKTVARDTGSGSSGGDILYTGSDSYHSDTSSDSGGSSCGGGGD